MFYLIPCQDTDTEVSPFTFFISDNNVFRLLRIGKDLLVENLMHRCAMYLLEHENCYSLAKLYKTSRKYKLQVLHDHVTQKLQSDVGNELLAEFSTSSDPEQTEILRTLYSCKQTRKRSDGQPPVDISYCLSDEEKKLYTLEMTPRFSGKLSFLGDTVYRL